MTDKTTAYNRYRNGITKGTRVSITPEALHQDFVDVMSRQYPRVIAESNRGLVEDPDCNRVYEELLCRSYVPLYEAGLSNRGPSFQLVEFDRTLGSSPEEKHRFELKMWTYSNQHETVFLPNGNIEYSPDNIVFNSEDDTEHLSFTRVKSPSGVDCWRMEHIVGRNIFTRLHLTEIVFS